MVRGRFVAVAPPPPLLLLLLTAIGILLQEVTWQAVGESVTTSLEIARFDLDPLSCRAGTFVDASARGIHPPLLGSLILNEEAGATGSCHRGFGVENYNDDDKTNPPSAPVLSATKDIKELVSHMQSPPRSGISFELWFKPFDVTNETSAVEPIFTIGSPPGANVTRSIRDCTGYIDLQLRQIGPHLELEYHTSHHRVECNPLRQIADLPLTGDLAHVVISLADRDQSIFLNGVPNPRNDELIYPFSATLAHWHESYKLQFFSDPYIVASGPDESLRPWQGQIYSFSVHDAAFGENDARRRFASGLPPAQPVGLDVVAMVREDEDAEGGSFDIVIHDLGAEVAALLSLNNATSDWTTGNPIPVIMSLPERGQLYQMDGTIISEPETEVPGPPFSVVYLPPKDGFSAAGEPYATFTYYVNSGGDSKRDGLQSDESEVATVYIHVAAMNDAPLPISSHVSLPAGINHTTKIILGGTDVDGNDSITNAYVPAYGFPQHGALYWVNPDGTYGDQILPSDDEGGTVIPNSCVGYRYGSREIPASPDGLVATDVVSFAVEDSSGARSADGNVTISVYASLFAVPSKLLQEMTALEDDPQRSPITIRGMDLSGLKREVAFEMMSLPQHGRLFETNDLSQPLAVGTVVSDTDSFPYVNGVLLHYESEPNFFTSPSTLHQPLESFDYRVVTYDNFLTGLSLPARQEIVVRNVNDVPVLTVPSDELEVHAFSALIWDQDHCSRDANETSVCRCRAVINNISVSDNDNDVDLVRVDVNCSRGMISLNASHASLLLADFTSCSERNVSTWSCRGSGNGDRTMTFLAYPNNIGLILSGMTYESFVQGPDSITVTIYDGIGDGNCLTKDEHTRSIGSDDHFETSFHEGCSAVVGSIPIRVIKEPRNTTRGEDIPAQLWVALLLPVVVLVGIALKIVKGRKKARHIAASNGVARETTSNDTTKNKDRKKDTGKVKARRWIQHRDPKSGDWYYEDTKTRRVTWTEPQNG